MKIAKLCAAALIAFFGNVTARGETARPAPDYGAMRAQGEAAIRERLIDPSSAEIEWPFGFIEGTWPTIFKNETHDGHITCGFVNAKNRMGGYGGRSAFVVVLSDNQIRHLDIGKPNGSDWTSKSCRKSASIFPPPPQTTLASAASSSSETPTRGIADELAKLATLREDGVLSEEEFQSQKQKLLNN